MTLSSTVELIVAMVGLTTTIAMLLILWFQTHVVEEYLDVFGLSRIPPFKEWARLREDDPEMTLHAYLLVKNTFTTRLLSCPICIGAWIALAVNLALGWSTPWNPWIAWLPSLFFGLSFYHIFLKLTR